MCSGGNSELDLTAVFKRKKALLSPKHLGTTYRLGGSCHFPLAVILYVSLLFPANHCHFSIKDPCFIGITGFGSGIGKPSLN